LLHSKYGLLDGVGGVHDSMDGIKSMAFFRLFLAGLPVIQGRCIN